MSQCMVCAMMLAARCSLLWCWGAAVLEMFVAASSRRARECSYRGNLCILSAVERGGDIISRWIALALSSARDCRGLKWRRQYLEPCKVNEIVIWVM